MRADDPREAVAEPSAARRSSGAPVESASAASDDAKSGIFCAGDDNDDDDDDLHGTAELEYLPQEPQVSMAQFLKANPNLFADNSDASSTTDALSLAQLGPVKPLWKLVVEALFLEAESDEGAQALACLETLRRLCPRPASPPSTKPPEPSHDQHSLDFAPIVPRDAAQAMQAIAALLFCAHDFATLLDCLLNMDELNAELSSVASSELAPSTEMGCSTESGDAAGKSNSRLGLEGAQDTIQQEEKQGGKLCVQSLFERLDALQGCPDREVRRWAVKGLWRALHACARHDRCTQYLPGLEAFECGLFPLEHLSVQALVAVPPGQVLAEIPGFAVEKSRSAQLRQVLLRRAFAQSLLTRAVQLEQRGRRRGSRTSFALGSTGSQSAHSSSENGPFSSMGSGRRDPSNSFETGSGSMRERAPGSIGAISHKNEKQLMAESAATLSAKDATKITDESSLSIRQGRANNDNISNNGDLGGDDAAAAPTGAAGRPPRGPEPTRASDLWRLRKIETLGLHQDPGRRKSELVRKNPHTRRREGDRLAHAPRTRQTDLVSTRQRRSAANSALGLGFEQPRRPTELASVFGRPGLERKPQMVTSRPSEPSWPSDSSRPGKASALALAGILPAGSRSDARGSDLSATNRSEIDEDFTGLQIHISDSCERLAQLTLEARRSSMSFVGSVHTFRSEDLASCIRDSSALGLEASFQFPRLTDISIPENEAYSTDRRIWSSKGTSSHNWSSPLEAGSMHGAMAAGIEYTDCATILEIITGHLIEPFDAHSFQTTNAFTQTVSVAAQDLVPVLLCMLAWMSDNRVRKEFVGSLFTLCASSARNLQIIQSADSWRPGLLRLLQTIPRDRDFQGDAAEFILHRVVEMLCMSNLRIHPRDGLCARGLDRTIYETAVLAGWKRDSVEFVRSLLCAQVHMLDLVVGPAALHFFRLVEVFLLYMPAKGDALLGYTTPWRRIALRALQDRNRSASSEAGCYNHDSVGTLDEYHEDPEAAAASNAHSSAATATAARVSRADSESKQSMVSLEGSDGEEATSVLGVLPWGRRRGDGDDRGLEARHQRLQSFTDELDEERKVSLSLNEDSDFEIDLFDHDLTSDSASRMLRETILFTETRDRDDNDDEGGDEDDDDRRVESGEAARWGLNDDNWLWDPILSQCAPIEMAENQVDFLEFQILELRRGVDFGLHLDKHRARFADFEFAQYMLSMLDRVLETASADQSRDKDRQCLENVRDRLHLLVAALERYAEEIEADPRSGNDAQQGLRRRIFIFNAQRDIVQARLRAESTCSCTFCCNSRLADAAVARGLDRLANRPSSSRSVAFMHGEQATDEAQARSLCEHLVLREDADDVDRPRSMQEESFAQLELTLETVLDSQRICPVCKEHVNVSRSTAQAGHAGYGDGTAGAGSKSASTTTTSIPHSGANSAIHLWPPSPRDNEFARGEGRREAVVFWKGFAWHKSHLRCYTCSRVLKPQDEDDPPEIDRIGGCWPYCAECIAQLESKCPACGEDAAGEAPDSIVFPNHRTWHKGHASCARCGGAEGASQVSSEKQLLLCDVHKPAEEAPHCAACLEAIKDPSEGAVLEEGIYLHRAPQCMRCNVCHQPLTAETARCSPLEKYKRAVFCDECCESQYRPTCVGCMKPVFSSAPRRVLVPTRAGRVDEEPIELVEHVRTGDDGRLRCHDDCCCCSACSRPLHDDVCFLRPSADMSHYELFCEHDFARLCQADATHESSAGSLAPPTLSFHAASQVGAADASPPSDAASQSAEVGSPALQVDTQRDDASAAAMALSAADAAHDHTQGDEQGDEPEEEVHVVTDDVGLVEDCADEQQSQAVTVGTFLFIDRAGAQQGPVSGDELYQLALQGTIDANTHVWTPGMAQWKPLSQLSQRSL